MNTPAAAAPKAHATALSYENAPAFSLPLRFFLSAPLFLATAGMLLLWAGPDTLSTRWNPAALAITHLVTLGFMLMVMLGGLIQIMPVVMGVQLPAINKLAPAVHLGLCVGASLLPAAFVSGHGGLFVAAATVLGLTVLVFLLGAVAAARHADDSSPTGFGVRVSLFGLGVAVALGVVLALGMALGWRLPFVWLTDLHAAWGLAVWAGLLLAALSFVVVPMFQLTPPYNRKTAVLLIGVIGLGAVGSALATLFAAERLIGLFSPVLAVGGTIFVVQTLRLQQQRRRARRDPTFLFWRSGLWCALASLCMPLIALFAPQWAASPRWATLFGVLLGLGGFVSLITGMLYKIMPFLAWLHLQDLGRARRKVPSMALLLPESRMRLQYRVHWSAVVLTVAAVFYSDPLARLAGAGLAADGLLLFGNLLLASLSYRRAQHSIANFAADAGRDKG